MNKPANPDHPIHELIAQRWSPRAFSERFVEREKLLSLFEAARWAPSSYNGQPWRFIVATRDVPPEFERMLGCLIEFNQGWAKSASALLIAVAAKKFEHNGKPNRHGTHDTGMALQNLAIQAMSMGLFVHFMAGFDPEKTREIYNIPADFEPITAAAIGYPGDPAILPADLREKETGPRSRKQINEFLFSGKFGDSWPGA